MVERMEASPGVLQQPALSGSCELDWKRRLLETCVPVNALTESHLRSLLREARLEAVYRGQQLFDVGDCDGCHVYLLAGQVAVEEAGARRLLGADDAEACFPLLHSQPRRDRVTAALDSYIIRFDSRQLDAMLAWDQAARHIELDIAGSRDMDEDAEWMQTLLRSNLFYRVPPMNIRQVLGRFQPEYRSSGERVLRQGELGDSCYIIKEGRVGVYQAKDERGPAALVAELGVGQCFGEEALVNEAPRNATVTMLDNGVLMRLDKQSFYLLLRPPPVQEVGAETALTLLAEGAQLLDVRTMAEFERDRIPGACSMPLAILALKLRLLDPQQTCVVYCDTGRRAVAAAHFLGLQGYQVVALQGSHEPLRSRRAVESGLA